MTMTKNPTARIYQNVDGGYDVVVQGIESVYTTFDFVEASHYAEHIADVVVVRLLEKEAYAYIGA